MGFTQNDLKTRKYPVNRNFVIPVVGGEYSDCFRVGRQEGSSKSNNHLLQPRYAHYACITRGNLKQKATVGDSSKNRRL